MSVKLILIFAGGGIGALMRYTVAGWAQKLGNGSFPVGTLAVNVLGCLLIGLLIALFAGPTQVREEHRMALLIGFLGAFTTFSTFGWETFALINDREFAKAALNVVLNNALGLAAVWVSYRLAQKWFGVA